VQPAAGALLHLGLVQLAAQRDDVPPAPGVGVGVAGRDRAAVAVHSDHRRCERVQRDAADPALQLGCGQVGDDLLELVDDLVWVDHACTVRSGVELVRNLPPAALHGTPRRVVDVAPACRGPDIEGQHEGVQSVVPPHAFAAVGHVPRSCQLL
jgi:hypothetical protein